MNFKYILFDVNHEYTKDELIRNTVDETIVEDSIKILDSNKDEVKNMVANNAFIIKEMKEKVRKEGMKEGIEKGKADVLMKLLIVKFKSIPENYENKINELPDKVLDEIVVNIFDMNSIEDLNKYF